jgi:hypothetical protein
MMEQWNQPHVQSSLREIVADKTVGDQRIRGDGVSDCPAPPGSPESHLLHRQSMLRITGLAKRR